MFVPIGKKIQSSLAVLLAAILLLFLCPTVAADASVLDPPAITIEAATYCKVGTEIHCEISVSQAADYEFMLVWKAIGRDNPVVSLKIDRAYPFETASRIEFSNNWIDSSVIRTDEKGNEIAAEQILSTEPVQDVARDHTGKFEDPYTVYLSAGIHSVDLRIYDGEFDLEKIIFHLPEQPESYADWLKKQEVFENISDPIVIEGESASLKNDNSLVALSDSASAAVSPASPKIKKLNYIGGSNWSGVGDQLEWQFSCPADGYYALGFVYRQNTVINGISYRHLRIDGVTPYAEAKRLKFSYGNSWRFTTFSDGNQDYLIYLKKGTHTLSLTATAGELSEVYAELQNVIADLGDLYIDITMIVGETVDNYRSYELFNQIPDFNRRLKQNIKSLNDLIDTIENLQEQTSGSLVSNIVGAVEILQLMLDNPYSAHRYKSSYYTAYTNLSSTLGTLTNMPLDLDRILIFSEENEPQEIEVGLLKKLMFSVRRFLKTFAGEYEVQTVENSRQITLWVGWGRDQAQVLNALIRESFTPTTGISVNLKVTNASLIQGILAGKGPDIVLNMSRSDPVNLAMRGALISLSDFDDYQTVSKRFLEGSAVPYTYRNKVYALPDTQNFYMMFVRTDILEQFGLEIPKTWEDFLNVATVLQRNNLGVALPYTAIADSGTVNVGVGGLTLYPTLLFQNGLSIYNDTQTGVALTEAGQLRVFTEWTEWYTNYKIPTVMDFYNRFRIGSAPVGISSYTLITQIKATCPEINGKWTVCEIPGTVSSDGGVDHTCAGSGSGCGITKLSHDPDAAWEFLKWWTSSSTQVRYSNNLESYLGPLGRLATSNLEAFEEIGWDADILPALQAQQKNIKEVPEIPGGYYTARGIDQAFWNVIEQSKKPKDMLVEWSDVVNREIKRKQIEYQD